MQAAFFTNLAIVLATGGAASNVTAYGTQVFALGVANSVTYFLLAVAHLVVRRGRW